MPYSNNNELLDSVKDHLLEHAQSIFREAFNHALEEYKDAEDRKNDAMLEETTFKVAWVAVKNKYIKDEGAGL